MHSVAGDPVYKYPDTHAEEHDEQDDAHQGNHSDWPHRQRGDPVDRERQHLRERILRITMQPGKPVVCNGRGRETELNSKTAHEYVHFAVQRQRAQRASAHQTEISVVRDDLGTQPIENAVVEVSAGSLEPAVAGSFLPDGENNFRSTGKILDHPCDDRHVVLQVCVKRNDCVRFSDLGEQPGQQRILVSDIA